MDPFQLLQSRVHDPTALAPPLPLPQTAPCPWPPQPQDPCTFQHVPLSLQGGLDSCINLGPPRPQDKGCPPKPCPTLFPASFQLQILRETSGLSAPRTFPAGGGSLVSQRRKSSRDLETTKPKQSLPVEKGLRLAAPPSTPASGSTGDVLPAAESGQQVARAVLAALGAC